MDQHPLAYKYHHPLAQNILQISHVGRSNDRSSHSGFGQEPCDRDLGHTDPLFLGDLFSAARYAVSMMSVSIEHTISTG